MNTFGNEAHAILSRVSNLLRRPLEGLAQDLLAAGGSVLADYIADALAKDGIDAHEHLPQWARDSVLFDLAAKRERVPLNFRGWDCWTVFCIKRRKPKQPAERPSPRLFVIGKGGIA